MKSASSRIGIHVVVSISYDDNITLRAPHIYIMSRCLHGFIWPSLAIRLGGIDLQMNADKTKYLCFNQKGYISTLNGGSLKLMDKFTNIGSSISSTEKWHQYALSKGKDYYR